MTESTMNGLSNLLGTFHVIRGAARNLPRVSARKMRESKITVIAKVPGVMKIASATSAMFAMIAGGSSERKERK